MARGTDQGDSHFTVPEFVEIRPGKGGGAILEAAVRWMRVSGCAQEWCWMRGTLQRREGDKKLPGAIDAVVVEAFGGVGAAVFVGLGRGEAPGLVGEDGRTTADDGVNCLEFG